MLQETSIVAFIIRPKAFGRIMDLPYDPVGPKNGLHAVGYNYAENEPIWMKSRTLWVKCLWLALADFWRDPRSSDDLTRSRIFLWGK